MEEGDIPDSVIETIDGHGSWSACAASVNTSKMSRGVLTLRGPTRGMGQLRLLLFED